MKDRKTDSAIPRPAQSDLEKHFEDSHYLLIGNDDATRHGEPLANGLVTAPMYVTTQEWDDCIEFTYIMLYAFQGGQTFRGLRLGAHFNCIVNETGWHQGDLEWQAQQTAEAVNHFLQDDVLAQGSASHQAGTGSPHRSRPRRLSNRRQVRQPTAGRGFYPPDNRPSVRESGPPARMSTTMGTLPRSVSAVRRKGECGYAGRYAALG